MSRIKQHRSDFLGSPSIGEKEGRMAKLKKKEKKINCTFIRCSSRTVRPGQNLGVWVVYHNAKSIEVLKKILSSLEYLRRVSKFRVITLHLV